LAKKQKNLGNDYYSQKNYDEAEKHYLKSLEIYEDLENTNPKIYLSSLATILKDIGDNYLKKKNYDEAEKRYQRCIKIREDLAKENPENHLKDLATILKDIGDSYFDQKQYDKAEKYYLRCLKIREELAKNDSDYFQSDLFDVLYSLSLTYGQLENYSAAIQYTNVCNEVLLIEKDKDSFKSYLEPFLVQNYGSLSWYYLFTKEYAQSEQSARRVLKLDDTQTWVKTNLAHALLFQDRFSKAEKIYKELSQIKREDNETFSKTLLEDFDKLGKAGAIPKERKADVEKIRKMLRE
jgi:tetratricopeptide (TPR) repeat protein